jgi:hypothetical protein
MEELLPECQSGCGAGDESCTLNSTVISVSRWLTPRRTASSASTCCSTILRMPVFFAASTAFSSSSSRAVFTRSFARQSTVCVFSERFDATKWFIRSGSDWGLFWSKDLLELALHVEEAGDGGEAIAEACVYAVWARGRSYLGSCQLKSKMHGITGRERGSELHVLFRWIEHSCLQMDTGWTRWC